MSSFEKAVVFKNLLGYIFLIFDSATKLKQELHRSCWAAVAVGQSVDVEDGEMPDDDDPNEAGQKHPAQAVVGEEVHPQASTAHIPSDRHPGAADTVGQDKLPDHDVGEEIHPKGSTAGFQSNRKHSRIPPSETQHSRPSKRPIIAEEPDERAVHRDVVTQARHPKRRHTDSSHHNSRDGTATASDSSEEQRPSLHESPATEKPEAQRRGLCKTAAVPDSARTGHVSSRSTRKASAAQQQGALHAQTQLSRGSPVTALEVGMLPVPTTGAAAAAAAIVTWQLLFFRLRARLRCQCIPSSSSSILASAGTVGT